MSRAQRNLAELRAARDRARDAFDQRLGRAKVDLKPSALKQRVIADAKVKAMALAGEAIEIANDSRGVVIGTGAALALWLARRPIGRATAGLWEKHVAPNLPGAQPPAAGKLADARSRLASRLSRLLAAESKEIKNHD